MQSTAAQARRRVAAPRMEPLPGGGPVRPQRAGRPRPTGARPAGRGAVHVRPAAVRAAGRGPPATPRRLEPGRDPSAPGRPAGVGMTDQGTGLDDKPPHDPGSRTRRRWRRATERAGASRDRRGSSAGRLLPAREPDDPARRPGRCRARRRAGPAAVGAELKRRGELERSVVCPTCTPVWPRSRRRRTPRTTPRSSPPTPSVAASCRPASASCGSPYDPTRDVDQLVDRVRGVADEMRLPVARGTGRRLRATLASTIVPRRIR